MRKLVWIFLAVVVTSCNSSKEQELKKMLGSKNQAAEAVAAAEKNPTFDTLTAAGLALSQAKVHDKAVSYFERAVALQPKSALGHSNVCAEYNSLGKWDTAMNHCEKAVALDPKFQLAKNNLKFSQDQKAKQLKVIQSLKAKAEASQGKDRHVALVDLGFEYYKMGDYGTAVSTWKKVPKSNDDLYVRTLNNLGSAYIIMKKYDLAKASLEEAAKLSPQNQLVKNNMAWLKTESTAKK
jgi:tetratricopeptide (TPR) repeat protein